MWLCAFWIVSGIQFSHADNPPLKTLTLQTYQKLLHDYSHKPFLLIIWSIDCPSCLEEMQLLSELHERYPQLKMIMLATDPKSATEQIQMYLEQYQLHDIENFLFDEKDTERLHQLIDKSWRGEVPRSYFFKNAKNRKAVSGLIDQEMFDGLIVDVVKGNRGLN